ncbi:MAG: hypothetical protein WA138_03290 [Parvibaculum sp.]
MAVLSSPIMLRYDGLDAENHQVDLSDLGESLKGAARMASISANFAYTGRVSTRKPSMQVRVLGGIAQDGCWQIPILIAPLVPVLPDIYHAVSSNLVGVMINWTLAKFGGRRREAEMFKDIAEKAIEEQGLTARHSVSEMRYLAERAIDAQLSGARSLVRPIGNSCEVLTVGGVSTSMPVDIAAKDAILANGNIETLDEQNYTVLFSELDRRNKTGKVSIRDDVNPIKRYSAVISDPSFDAPDNVYAESLSAEKWITVRGKMQIKDDEVHKIFISAATDIATKITSG